MLKRIVGVLVLGAALGGSPMLSLAKGGGGGGGGGGGVQHSSSVVHGTAGTPTSGVTATSGGTTTSGGTRTLHQKSAYKKISCWNGQGHPGPGGPTVPRCGSSGGASASNPPTCQANGEGCQRQH
jgi:hypothetical protein